MPLIYAGGRWRDLPDRDPDTGKRTQANVEPARRGLAGKPAPGPGPKPGRGPGKSPEAVPMPRLPIPPRTPPGTPPATDTDTNRGPSDADIQSMVDAAVAAQAEADASRRRSNAFDEMQAVLRGYGIDLDGTFTQSLREMIYADKSDDAIMLELRETQAYNRRFTGMADLIERGQFMSEAEYIVQERSYRNLMAQYDLPTGFYDSYDDFGRFIANGVSVKELDDRIITAQTILDEDAPAEYKQALQSLYGVNDGDMLAYVLDGDKAQDAIQRRLRTASFAGAAAQGGFDSLNESQASAYAASLGAEFDNMTQQERIELERRTQTAGVIADRDQFLASIEGDDSFQREDLLDVEFLGDVDKGLASQRRAERERGRFTGRSGVGRGALGRRQDY